MADNIPVSELKSVFPIVQIKVKWQSFFFHIVGYAEKVRMISFFLSNNYLMRQQSYKLPPIKVSHNARTEALNLRLVVIKFELPLEL